MTAATLTAESILQPNSANPESAFEAGQPQRHKKGWVSWAFKKAVDLGARAVVTNTIKIAAATTVLGAGASAYMTIGVTMAAAGVGAGLYSYLKDYAVAKYKGEKTSFWDKSRLKKAKWALLAGAAGGAFGSWLAGTDTFQAGLSLAKEFSLKALSGLADAVSGVSYAAVPVAAALPVLVDSSQPQNALGRLWDMAMKSQHTSGKMLAQLLKTHPDALDSLTPQQMKDRAHDIMRLKDIPLAERVSLAKELATEAKARGNKQAVQFLKDLAKLEPKLPKVVALEPVHVTAPRLPAVSELPVETLESVPVLVDPEPEVVAAETVPARDFREAALCKVEGPDAQGVYDASCNIIKEEMQPGDHITFAANGLSVTTQLTEDSVSVPTGGFLHEKVIADGVHKVATAAKGLLVAAAPPKP